MNAMIDTLKVAKAFEDAGFVKAQAETLAITIAEATSETREDLVTKEFLRAELATTRREINSEIGGVRGEISAVRAETISLRAEIATSKNEMIRWFLGAQVTLVVVLVALTNFTKLL